MQNKRVLNGKEAREYLGLSRYCFDKAVNEGSIRFKLIGNKKFYPLWVLDKWQNDTTNHIDCSSEVTHTTHISRTSLTDKGYSLENLAEQLLSKKQSNTACKGLQSYKRKLINKPMVSFQV